jgi:hypothetical protein
MSMAWQGAFARGLAALLLAAAGAAGAQASGVDLVGVAGSGPAGGQLFFECNGSPTCSGEFVIVSQEADCSNLLAVAGTIQLSVPDISIAGPVSGSGTLVASWENQRNPDGTCTPTAGGTASNAISFSGTSDGVVANVTYTIRDTDGSVHQVAGTLMSASAAYAHMQVSGSVAGATPEGGQVAFTFTCAGSPVCTGTYSGSERDGGCSNTFSLSGTISFVGFDVSSGGFAGTVVLQNADSQDTRNADGTCSLRSSRDLSVSYSGTFDGGEGTLVFSGTSGEGIPFSIPGTFSATGTGGTPPPVSPPPFGITVDQQITPTTASATAHIQPPAGDLNVGKTVGFYVFAFAPRSLVHSTKSALRPLGAKDDASTGCVLAQIDPATGQLRAASASNLTPAITTTLSAQAQSVTILNNASTPSIAGATFFVGYGTDASTMISSGVNANAVQVPGAQQCPGVFPKLPGSLSGLWYAGEQESGWGVDFTQRGVHVFAAFYTYDASGNPKWYVASDCRMAASALTSGRCSGDLYELTATPLFGVGSGGSHNPVVKAGTLQVDFASPSQATMTYTVGSVSRTVPIQRQLFRTGTVPPTIDYTDLWYAGEAASGWGMAISQQYDKMFLAWFVYDASGKPVWYTASDCAVAASGNGCSGDLYLVTGPPFGPTFDPSQVHVAPVGHVTATFSDPNNGTIDYTVNGVAASKAITRQVF